MVLGTSQATIGAVATPLFSLAVLMTLVFSAEHTPRPAGVRTAFELIAEGSARKLHSSANQIPGSGGTT